MITSKICVSSRFNVEVIKDDLGVGIGAIMFQTFVVMYSELDTVRRVSEHTVEDGHCTYGSN